MTFRILFVTALFLTMLIHGSVYAQFSVGHGFNPYQNQKALRDYVTNDTKNKADEEKREAKKKADKDAEERYRAKLKKEAEELAELQRYLNDPKTQAARKEAHRVYELTVLQSWLSQLKGSGYALEETEHTLMPDYTSAADGWDRIALGYTMVFEKHPDWFVETGVVPLLQYSPNTISKNKKKRQKATRRLYSCLGHGMNERASPWRLYSHLKEQIDELLEQDLPEDFGSNLVNKLQESEVLNPIIAAVAESD